MKYFVTETERKILGGSCYYEFYRGDWDEKKCIFWSEDSLNIHDNYMYTLKLDELIFKVVPYYDCFGETRIDEKQWKEIYRLAKEKGGELFDAVCEVSTWAEENFKEHKVFTILGL
jgi:hypothetical protein